MPPTDPQDQPPADDDTPRPDSPDDPTRPPPDGSTPTGSVGSMSDFRLSAVFDPQPDAQAAAPDPLLGMVIGGVRLIRVIGQGGMGKVYEGEQQKPRFTVAVKVMRPELTTPAMRRRFEHEAEILARLRHPGIAQIFSAGVESVLDVPVPYFVMEYIPEARTLTDYAEGLKLPIRARLDLFRSVCEAVAHGHQKGVVHRDLKPSNILVDATGQPKVIDFGVAKATDSDLALTTMHSDVGQLIGTLQYMGPEQLAGDPNEIDTRCDVYALGVVLYELLTGRLPYDVRQKAALEAMRIVKEEEPTPISALNKTLRRDVAVITGKCLEKDRARRYSSASELGADVARHLAGEPIQASPPSFLDSLVRLAKKHRAKAALAGAIASVVIAVIAAYVSRKQVTDAKRVVQIAKAQSDVDRKRVLEKTTEVASARKVIDEQARVVRQKDEQAARLVGLVVEAAKTWGQEKASINLLNEVPDLPPDAARQLASGLSRLRADLQLNGLKELSAESARHLAAYKGSLYLRGLAELSDEAAEELARHEGPVYLDGPEPVTLSDRAATLLRANPQIRLPRVVEFSPDTEAREVSTYYSLHAHGPTMKFYVFPEARVVVVVRVKPDDKAIETAIHVNVFAVDTAAERIQKWINNQHSDAIYPDAAEPKRRFTVDPKLVHATTTGPHEHEVGGNGDEYDRHEVEFAIDAFTDGDVHFRASQGAANAFVRTKDIAAPAPGRVPGIPE